MSDGDLICNFKKCRKILTETAYITRCSHVFCEEDVLREIQNQDSDKKCPACKSPLVQSFDLVKVNLNPCEAFKSMVLAGIRPEFVLDIATRAIMFWTYQMDQEILHQKLIYKTLKDSYGQMKINHEKEYGVLKSNLQDAERKIKELENELKIQNSKSAELAEKLLEKNREVQRWQLAYESVRRKQISELAFKRDNEERISEDKVHAANMGPQTMEALLGQRKQNRKELQENWDLRNLQEDNSLKRNESHCPRRADGGQENYFKHLDFNFKPRISPSVKSPKVFFGDLGCNRVI